VMSANHKSSLAKYDRIADRMRQHRQADKRGLLVVEGPSDKRLINRVSNKRWAVFPAGTRNNVASVVRDADALNLSRVAGLIDRDFDSHYDESKSAGLQIFTYEEADLEAVLVRGPWFEGIVDELGSEDKIRDAGGASSLRPIVIGIAGVIGIVRRENARRGWGLDFERLEFEKKVDAKSLQLAVPRLADAIAGKLDDSQSRVLVRELLADASDCEDRGPASFRGRDALEVVGVAFRRVYGNTPSLSGDTLGGTLRLHASEELFEMAPFPELVSFLG